MIYDCSNDIFTTKAATNLFDQNMHFESDKNEEFRYKFLEFEAPQAYLLEDTNKSADFQNEFQFDFSNECSGYAEDLDLFKNLLNGEDIDNNERICPNFSPINEESMNPVVSEQESEKTENKSKYIKYKIMLRNRKLTSLSL